MSKKQETHDEKLLRTLKAARRLLRGAFQPDASKEIYKEISEHISAVGLGRGEK